MTEPIVYIGKDLEAMSFTVNYHNWIIDEFRPFIGKHLVEVGAGTGSVSSLLLGENPETLALVEPSEMFELLKQNITGVNVSFYNSIFTAAAADIVSHGRPDTIIYVNVLEHIEDDENELRAIFDCLDTGGHALIFVPAMMSLYGPFDKKIGHFRRYSKPELEEKGRAAGFEIVMSRYFDLAGVIPWFVKYRILGSDSLDPGAVKLYDKLAVPITRRLENILPVPVGKNVIMALRRSAHGGSGW
jgi:SAM-dependent methyltransferase